MTIVRQDGRLGNSIALVIPAYNEELTIGDTIDSFLKQIPSATLVVVDNNSTDKTAQIAGAKILAVNNKGRVIREPRQGKAMALRKAFSEIVADFYVVVDADDTYPAEAVHEMISRCLDGADMVVGDRHSSGAYRDTNRRLFHGFGNGLVTWIINTLFRSRLRDIMSGYRVLSRKFVKNFPIMSSGFEIETEMTLHALDKRFMVEEIPVNYRVRGSENPSKLNTFSDGFRVLKAIFWIFKDFRPLIFFLSCALLFFIGGVASGFPVIAEFIVTRKILHIPLAILATGLMLFSIIFLTIGIVLDTVAEFQRFNYELKLLSDE